MPESMLPDYYDPNEVLNVAPRMYPPDTFADDMYEYTRAILKKQKKTTLLSFFDSCLFPEKNDDGTPNKFYDPYLISALMACTDPSEAKLSPKKMRNKIAKMLVHFYEMVYIKNGSTGKNSGSIYLRDSTTEDFVMRVLGEDELDRVIKRLLEDERGDEYDSDDIDKIKKLLPVQIEERYQEPPAKYIMLPDYIVYDVDTGRPMMKSELDKDRPKVYYRLFDSPEQTKSIALVQPFTEDECEQIMRCYEFDLEMLEHPENSKTKPGNYDKSTLPEEIMVWANGDVGVGNDMMRALASPLLKNKPLGAFFLIGQARGGKSTFINLLNTMYGRSNVSNVRLAQLAEPHYALEMANRLINAVDEEEEGVVKYQTEFKTMADHGELDLEVLYKQNPMKVNCRFMSFFPCNYLPRWEGTSKKACLKRTLSIPFFADLSKYDSKGENFVHKTYTKTFFLAFLPKILAMATYYTEHPFQMSKRMQALQRAIEVNNDPAVIYRDRFETYYDGFPNWKILYNDYVAWCKMNDYRWQTLDDFRELTWLDYATGEKPTRDIGGSKIKMYVGSKKEGLTKMYLHKGLTYMGEYIESMHERGISIVGRKDEAADANRSSRSDNK